MKPNSLCSAGALLYGRFCLLRHLLHQQILMLQPHIVNLHIAQISNTQTLLNRQPRIISMHMNLDQVVIATTTRESPILLNRPASSPHAAPLEHSVR